MIKLTGAPCEDFRRFIRKEGFTEGELARLIGVHPATLSRYFNGKSEWPWEVASKSVKVLNITFERFQEFTAPSIKSNRRGRPRGKPRPRTLAEIYGREAK